jgi:hypothetical protein
MKRVRIPTERDLQAIKDGGLHEVAVGALASEVRRALDALIQALPGNEPSLEVVIETLASLLKAQSGIRKVVLEVVGLGGTPLDETEFYVALARWIIDNQVGKGFEWDPWALPQRWD